MNPASLTIASSNGPGEGSMPASRVALMNSVLIFMTAQSAGRESSGEVHLRSISMNSL